MQSSLNDFHESLSQLKTLVEHMESLNVSLDRRYLDLIAATAKSSVVLSCGYYENFLKGSFMEFIENVNSMSVQNDCIRDAVWDTNIKKTIDVLRYKDQKNSEYSKIVLDYASFFKEDKKKSKPVLIREAFIISGSNPKYEVLKGFFNGIGVKIEHNKLLNDEFRNIEIFKSRINAFVELRNSFAHGDKSMSISSLQEVKDYFIFLERTASIVNSVLENELVVIEDKHYKSCFKYLDI